VVQSAGPGAVSATRTPIWTRLTAAPIVSRRGHSRAIATTAVAAKTTPTNAVPTGVRPPSSRSVPGTTMAPTRPSPATISEPHEREIATPTPAIAAAMSNATGFGTRS
jgi:hypothetical protein